MGELVISERSFGSLGQHWPTLQAAARAPNLDRVELVPLEALPALRDDIAQAMDAATREAAKKAVELLLGSYARHDIAEPDIWTRAMVSAFERYPRSVMYRAVEILTDRCRFIPNKADLVAVLEDLTRELRTAHAMAVAMEREHQRREEDARMNASIEADRRAFRERHGGRSPLEVIRQRQMGNPK